MLLYNLSLWQKNNYKQLKIANRRYSFRNLTQLASDHPYFCRSAIRKAIARIEKKLGKDFLVRRECKTHKFSIGPSVLKLQKENKLFSFQTGDAVLLDDVRAAVILNNLRFVLKKFKKHKTDLAGNRYVRLSPKELAPILGYSEDTIAAALKKMRGSAGPLVQHPDDRSLYTLRETLLEAVVRPESRVGEVHNKLEEVHGRPAKVHSAPGEVHATVGTYSNECMSECGKRDINVYSLQTSAPPRLQDLGCHSLSSKGLVKLQSLVQVSVKDAKVSAQRSPFLKVIPQDLLPYDHITPGSLYDLPYDHIDSISPAQWIEQQVEEMSNLWTLDKFRFGKRDLEMLRHYYILNFDLPECTLPDLYRHVREVQTSGIAVVNTRFKSGNFDLRKIVLQCSSATSFLMNLPRLVAILQCGVSTEDGKLHVDGVPENPYNLIDYDYLNEPLKGQLLPPNYSRIPLEVISQEHQPVF